MLTVVADTCGDHDTLGSACSCESNTCRYALDKRYMHACRESFLKVLLAMPNLDKRDQVNNLNFFMYVPFDEKGNLNFADGISSPGKYVEMKAEMDVYAVVSNCAAEQSLQCLQSHAGSDACLGLKRGDDEYETFGKFQGLERRRS